MATIISLYRTKDQPSVNTDGQNISLNENWIMITSSSVLPAEANQLLINASNNELNSGWLRIGIDGHPANNSLRVIDFEVERDENKDDKFNITTSLTNNKDSVNQATDPLNAEVFFSYVNVDTVEEVDIDPITGEIIAASNGESYWPKAKKKGTLKRIVISRNEQSYNENTAKLYENKLNKDTISINGRPYPPRSVLLESWIGNNSFNNEGDEYWKVKYSVLTDPDNLHKISLIDVATGPDKNGIHPQQVTGDGAVPNRAYKLGRVTEGDGLYMTRDDQQDPSKYYTNDYWVHEEIEMNNVLRL